MRIRKLRVGGMMRARVTAHSAYTVARGEEILDRWTRERGW